MSWIIWLALGFGTGYYVAQPKEKRMALKGKALKYLPNPKIKMKRR